MWIASVQRLCKEEITKRPQLAEKNGGDDETRTRDLCRDSPQYMSIFNDLEEHGRHLSHCKYIQDKVIVYRAVYHASSLGSGVRFHR
jgi:hypothetical protein